MKTKYTKRMIGIALRDYFERCEFLLLKTKQRDYKFNLNCKYNIEKLAVENSDILGFEILNYNNVITKF